MAIFTPRGLKIRLPFDYAFALIARLYPKVDAFKVLKTTEGLESIPLLITVIAGLVCFYLRLPLLEIGLYVFVASIVGFLIMSFGLYVIPGIDRLGTFYSYISGFGIFLIILTVYGFFTVGWQSVIVFFIAKFLAGIVKFSIEGIIDKRFTKKTGVVVTTSERNFFNAYRLHASRLGKSIDITVTDEELKEENWKPVLIDLARKWPEVVKRFTVD